MFPFTVIIFPPSAIVPLFKAKPVHVNAPFTFNVAGVALVLFKVRLVIEETDAGIFNGPALVPPKLKALDMVKFPEPEIAGSSLVPLTAHPPMKLERITRGRSCGRCDVSPGPCASSRASASSNRFATSESWRLALATRQNVQTGAPDQPTKTSCEGAYCGYYRRIGIAHVQDQPGDQD
jgi:hypothetical protein